MKNRLKYIKRAKELGAKEAGIIPAQSIVVAEWVRMKCQFGCDGYGQSLTCPPYSPAPDFTRRMLSFYKNALLVHGGAYANIHEIIPVLEQEIFLDGYHKAFGMGPARANSAPNAPSSAVIRTRPGPPWRPAA